MSVDHLAKAKFYAERLEVSQSLMHGQIANVEALQELLKVGTAILGHLLDSEIVDAEIAYEPDALADVLRESSESYQLIAKRALDWFNLTPATTGDKQ